MKKKKQIYSWCLLLLLFCVVGNTSVLANLPKSKSPNILIIIADDCTFSDLPLYGGVNVKTPAIDQLASEGMTFNSAYVTMSMCVPSRAELYTGKQPFSNGVAWNHGPARKGTKSMVDYFADYGYRTGIAGKVHVQPQEVFNFEMIDGLESNCVAETADFDPEGLREFMIKDKSQPFCLVTALVTPHIPWTVGDPSHFNPSAIKLPPYLADTKETRREFVKYLAEIEVMDQQVKATLDLLEEEGLDENTIVIFTSEQGAQFPFCKWTNYEMGVHTGFIVKWPKRIEKGTRSDALIQYCDVLPTLLEVMDKNISGDFDGESFLSVLEGKKKTHREFAYFMHNNIPEGPSYPIRSVTDGKFHYIQNLSSQSLYIEKHLMSKMPLNKYWPSWVFEASNDKQIKNLVTRYMQRPTEELYDISIDPNEQNNIANRDNKQNIKHQLKRELDNWRTKNGDPGVSLDTKQELQKAKKGKHFEKVL